MSFAVFDVFSEAIVEGKWVIGTVKRGTETGDVFTRVGVVDVIEDEGFTGSLGQSPRADGLQVQTLLYLRAEDLPTTNMALLVAGYMFCDTTTNSFFDVVSASIGKNQHTGEIEHVEITLEPTEAIDE